MKAGSIEPAEGSLQEKLERREKLLSVDGRNNLTVIDVTLRTGTAVTSTNQRDSDEDIMFPMKAAWVARRYSACPTTYHTDSRFRRILASWRPVCEDCVTIERCSTISILGYAQLLYNCLLTKKEGGNRCNSVTNENSNRILFLHPVMF